MIWIEKTDIYSTLTTWIYCAFWQMWSAEQQGYDSYIHWPRDRFIKSYNDNKKFSEISNAYEWYFKQPKIKQGKPDQVWTWENWQDPSPIPFVVQPLSVIIAEINPNSIKKFNADKIMVIISILK